MAIFASGAAFKASATTPLASGPTTTAMSPVAPSRTVERTCASIERPASSCRTLGRAERMRTPSPAASTMVRQRRALALMGTFVLRRRALAKGRSAAPNPLEPAWSAVSPRARPVSSPNGSVHQCDFTVATKSVSLRRKKRYTTGGPGTERAWLRRVIFLTGLFFILAGKASCRVVRARPSSGERMTNTMTDRQRREFLQLAVGGALAASLAPADSTPVAAEPLAQPVPFAGDTVLKMAVELASKPFKAPDAPPLPSVFSGLTFEQYAAIRRVQGSAIWSDQKLGFSLEPLHRGFVYTTPIAINIVENGTAEKVIYDSANFDFGPLKPPGSLGDLGFSGLRILRSADQGFEDVAIFQGATFYRARARAQPFGLTARGLAVGTGDDPGEA